MNLNAVDVKPLKDAVKVLNDSDILDERIKVVGVSKEKLATDLCDIVSQMVENAIEVPESVMQVYNLLQTEAAEAEVQEPTPAPAPAPAVAKKEKKKPEPAAAPAPAESATSTAPAPAPEKKKKSPPKSPVTRPTDFADVKKRLENPTNPTQFFDALLLTGGNVPDLIAKFQEECKARWEGFNGFKTPSSVTSHIKYREEHGYIYEKKENFIRLVGYKVAA